MFAGLYAHGGAAAAVDRQSWLAAMLDAEAALARACAAEGLIPQASAEAIVAVCHAERFDAEALEREGAEHATPVVGLVRALREAVGPDQDIVDTAAMLVARRALEPLLADAAGAADAAARLAGAHRSTPMAGRTLLQQALPTTFGLRAAGWLVGLGEAREEVEAVREARLAVQMGGPVGHRDPAIADRVAALLGLNAPTVPWQAIRVRVAELAGALGALSGVLAKIARDVTLLAQNEVGEVREGGEGRGGSSAMAHKRNPVASVSVLACATRVPGLVATLLAAMEQEHERAAGRWQAEAGTLSDLLAVTGSATAWGRDLLEHLEVDAARMAANLRALAGAGVAEAADPAAHLGAAPALVDRALEAHRA